MQIGISAVACKSDGARVSGQNQITVSSRMPKTVTFGNHHQQVNHRPHLGQAIPLDVLFKDPLRHLPPPELPSVSNPAAYRCETSHQR